MIVGLSRVKPGLADCIIGIFDEKDDPKVHSMLLKEATEQLSANGIIMLASSSTAITRLETFVRKEKLLKVFKRQKSKRRSLIILRRKN